MVHRVRTSDCSSIIGYRYRESIIRTDRLRHTSREAVRRTERSFPIGNAADRGPLHHAQKTARYLRGNIGKVDERQLKTLCETSGEALIGSKKAFSDDDPGATFFNRHHQDHMDEDFLVITYS
jgi:hypothetical protein